MAGNRQAVNIWRSLLLRDKPAVHYSIQSKIWSQTCRRPAASISPCREWSCWSATRKVVRGRRPARTCPKPGFQQDFRLDRIVECWLNATLKQWCKQDFFSRSRPRDQDLNLETKIKNNIFQDQDQDFCLELNRHIYTLWTLYIHFCIIVRLNAHTTIYQKQTIFMKKYYNNQQRLAVGVTLVIWTAERHGDNAR